MPGKQPTLPAKGKAKKAAPTTKTSLPVLSAQYIELEDGTQVKQQNKWMAHSLINAASPADSILRCRSAPVASCSSSKYGRMHKPTFCCWCLTHIMHVLCSTLQIPVKIPAGMSAEQAMAVVEYLKANPEAAKAAWEQAQAVMQTPGMANQVLGMGMQVCGTGQCNTLAAEVATHAAVWLVHAPPAITPSMHQPSLKQLDHTQVSRQSQHTSFCFCFALVPSTCIPNTCCTALLLHCATPLQCI